MTPRRPKKDFQDVALPGMEDLPSSTEASLAAELQTWWLTKAQEEVDRTVPKAIEYGSADLEVMGTAMQMLLPPEARSPEMGVEMALAFYALGKVARLFGAFERGERPSDDTIFDLGVYCRMMQRVRDTGSWPGKENR